MKHLLVLTIACIFSMAPLQANAEGTLEEAIELVELLGSPSFADRRRAMDQLLHLGPVAIGPLEEAALSRNRELRYRSRRLLESVRELEFERQLQMFVQSSGSKSDLLLPGWKRFRDRHGDGGDARQLFVAMQRAEPEIMRKVDTDAEGVSRLINQRAQSLQQARRFQGGNMSVGSIVAMLYCGTQSAVRLSDSSVKIIVGLCGYPAFVGELRRPAGDNRYYILHDTRSDLFRALFSDWMKRPGVYQNYQGFLLALNYDIRGVAGTAAHAIKQKDSSPQVKQYALQVLAEYGGEEHVEAVTTILADKTYCGGTQRVDGKQYRTQIRDVALVCLLAIEKLDAKEYGFPRFQIRNRIVLLTSIGFENDEEREKAHGKWRKYVAENK